jgi:hypothetical protein
MKDPKNIKLRHEVMKHSNKIIQYNEEQLKKPEEDLEDNVINLFTLIPNWVLFADQLKQPYTRKSRAKLQRITDTLRRLNTRNGYPSEWIPETPPSWPEDSENEPGKGKSAADQTQGQGAAEVPPQGPEDPKNSSEPGKGKSAAGQARGQGVAAESYDPDPSFKGIRTRYNEPILGWRKVGRDGRQYLVQKGSPEHQAFELRSQAGDDGVGRKAGRLYEASPDAVQLGVIDKDITKDDADRYVEVTGVAYKPLQVVSANSSDRFPVTVARVVFKNPAAVHWVFRTTLRRVAGKKDADLDIHDWSKKHGFVTSLEAPPRRFLIENPEYANAFPGRASVLPGRARALIRADDEDEALPEKEIKTLTDGKEIKTLTDGQEELRTRLDKLEKETKDQHKLLSDQMADMQKNITEQIAALIAKAVADMMSAQKAQTS